MKSTPLKPIRTAAAHRRALAELESLWEAKPGTPEFDRFEVLGILVEQYEQEKFPIEAPTLAEAIEFRMEQTGTTAGVVAAMLGGRSRRSEALRGVRDLSIRQVRQLYKFGIPADVLLCADDEAETEETPPVDEVFERLRSSSKRTTTKTKTKTKAGLTFFISSTLARGTPHTARTSKPSAPARGSKQARLAARRSKLQERNTDN